MSVKASRVIWVALGPLGDALMMFAALGEVQEHSPELKIEILARHNAGTMRDLAQMYPFEVTDASYSMLFRALLRAGRGDIVVIPPTFGTYPLLLRLFMRVAQVRGTSIAAFLDKEGSPSSSSISFEFQRPVIDNLRRLLSSAGLETAPPGAPPILRLAARPPAGLPDKPFILLHPFAANPARSLPPKRWRELLRELAHRYPDFAFRINAVSSDIPAARSISEGLAGADVLENLSVLELAGAIERAALYIGVDTGPTHLASLLRQKTIEIGNRSNPTWLVTYNPNAIVLTNAEHCTCDGKKGGACRVYEDGRAYYRCMYEISDADIFAAIDAALAHSSRQ